MGLGSQQTVYEEEVKPGVIAVKPLFPRDSLIWATIIVIMFYVVGGIYGYMYY